MSSQTILWIILAAVIALGAALYQYFYKAKNLSTKVIFFAFLRFSSVFLLLVLLINPKFKQFTYEIVKPTLVIAIDNSSSIKYQKREEEVIKFINSLKENEEIKNQFELDIYSFSEDLKDSLITNFDGKQTDIAATLNELNQIYKNINAPTVLITDGNQTYGNDYQYISQNYKQKIYPIVVGDTTQIQDLKIQQLNVNKYAYLKNEFPVEAIIIYNGEENITSDFQITNGKKVLYTKKINFNNEKKSQIINLTLPASNVGVQSYTASILPIENEKNKINNTKDFGLEVIDQKTNILVVSDIVHPDLGAIKNSIESNERRSIVFKKSSEVNEIDTYQLVILFQPTARFTSVYKQLKEYKKNFFTIAGNKTDWGFLNRTQEYYKQEITRQPEDYLGRYNDNYGTFIIGDINFNDFPPLTGTFGETRIMTQYDPILYKRIGNIDTDEPLLATIEDNGIRQAVLFGEGLWRWRAQTYLETKSFESFDDFMGKLIQYLSSNKKRSRLEVNAETFYYNNSVIKVQASYFTKNYEFDQKANLLIKVKEKNTQEAREIPFVLKNNIYEADLSGLVAGNYEYTVISVNENLSRNGQFTILNFDVEQQFLNADVTKLNKIATNTSGNTYFLNQEDELIKNLLNNESFKAIQKSRENIVSLIDWKYILALIILILSIEWFMRKYNGLI